MITTDDWNAHDRVLLEQYAETIAPPRTGKRGRPLKRWPKAAAYATVNKTYKNGHVAAVGGKLVRDTGADLESALKKSRCNNKINTAFVERQNGTDRTYNARKARKTCRFSKDLVVHAAVTWWVTLRSNVARDARGLRLGFVRKCQMQPPVKAKRHRGTTISHSPEVPDAQHDRSPRQRPAPA